MSSNIMGPSLVDILLSTPDVELEVDIVAKINFPSEYDQGDLRPDQYIPDYLDLRKRVFEGLAVKSPVFYDPTPNCGTTCFYSVCEPVGSPLRGVFLLPMDYSDKLTNGEPCEIRSIVIDVDLSKVPEDVRAPIISLDSFCSIVFDLNVKYELMRRLAS